MQPLDLLRELHKVTAALSGPMSPDTCTLEPKHACRSWPIDLWLGCRWVLMRYDGSAVRAGPVAAADWNELGGCQLSDRIATDRELLLLPLHLSTIQQGAGRDHGFGGSRQRDTSPPTPRVTMSSPSKRMLTRVPMCAGVVHSARPVTASQKRSRPSAPPPTTK